MADQSQNVGIKNSWSLVDFAKSHGKMKVTNELTNSQTGETFKSCAFVGAGGTVTLVGFSFLVMCYLSHFSTNKCIINTVIRSKKSPIK